MEFESRAWQNWAEALHRRGLNEFVAVLLEAGGPLNMIAAQMVYLSQPLFGRSASQKHLEALAHLLEEPEQTQSFVAYLREGTPR
jgi:hypothetical protein